MAFLRKDWQFSRSSFDDKSKEALYSELSTLIAAGVSLRQALELLASENVNKGRAQIFSVIINDIVQGKSLADSLQNHDSFTAYEYLSIRVGEETGKLLEVLEQLSYYFEVRIKLKRQMVRVLSYPFFLLLVTFGVLVFMLNGVVPMFKEVFARFDKELPPFTQRVLDVSDWFKDYFLFLVIIILAITALLYSQRKSTWFRTFFAELILRTPVIGQLVKKIYLARFCQSMTLLVSSRVPLLKSLSLVKGVIAFYPIEIALETISKKVEQGKSLSDCMQEHAIFDRKLVTLIRVAEETNSLDRMLSRLTKQYNDQVDHTSNTIGTLIEPVMILLVGFLVGVILVAMYQPLFNIGNILE